MDGVIRYTAGDALTESTRAAQAGFDPGHWVRAADFDERQFQGKQREVALQDRLTVVEQRNDELIELLRQIGELRGTLDQHGLLEEVEAAIKPAGETCQLPQSCTTRCDCNIPDFSPGNGNKARRRREALLGIKIVEDPTLATGEIKLVQPSPAIDPFTCCLECFGSGMISTGIEEASSTICNKCDGTGREKQ